MFVQIVDPAGNIFAVLTVLKLNVLNRVTRRTTRKEGRVVARLVDFVYVDGLGATWLPRAWASFARDRDATSTSSQGPTLHVH